MTTYRTVQGDLWDQLALDLLGREDRMPLLVEANPDLAREHDVLPDGLELVVPDVPAPSQTPTLPPWKRS